MQSSLMRKFRSVATATGLVALTIGAPFNANAHVMEGSPLAGSRGFINAMTRINEDGSSGTSCCHEQDGLGPLEEKHAKDPVTGKMKYRVLIKTDQNGTPLEEPIWQDIPDEAVLKYSDAVEFCKNLAIKEPENPDNATCKVPKTNALWANQIPHNAKPDGFKIWCYLPLRNDQ